MDLKKKAKFLHELTRFLTKLLNVHFHFFLESVKVINNFYHI